MSEPTGNEIIIEVTPPVGYLRLNRPFKANAMGPRFFNLLPKAIKTLEQDNEVKVIILTSTSRHFSSGLDLSEMQYLLMERKSETDRNTISNRIKTFQESIGSLATCTKPVIAAITGACIGGGLDLASCADFRLCSLDAVFSIREIKLGMIADLGSLQRLTRIISRGKLAELALTGDDITASQALEIGLVNSIFADKEELMQAVYEIATKIASNSPSAVSGTKKTLSNVLDEKISEQLDFVANINSEQLTSSEFRTYLAEYIKNEFYS